LGSIGQCILSYKENDNTTGQNNSPSPFGATGPVGVVLTDIRIRIDQRLISIHLHNRVMIL
ncbi:MAG: hypothetical protein N0E38_05610, partial [Candidatus Thiodiazotropha endolucinida]|nr:hypothetical protein [Candidatus Thiodiazotropha taylori]MCW4348420.1 hypothetical protein [Candidatus Thiodiazotropha endolucinida]